MTPQRRSQREILDDLWRAGHELHVAREKVAEMLLEGYSQDVEMVLMAEEAGISPRAAYNLLRWTQLDAAKFELFEKSERLLDLVRMDSRDEHEEAEYRRLLADEDLVRWLLDISETETD